MPENTRPIGPKAIVRKIGEGGGTLRVHTVELYNPKKREKVKAPNRDQLSPH